MKNYFYSFPGKVTLILCIGVLFYLQDQAQCLNNLGTRSYDTALTGIGYGNYTIRVPQWNPDSGLLVSVKVSALVSVQYGYSLKNVDVNPSIYTLMAGREDYISSPAMLHPYDNDREQRIGTFPLDPGQSVSQSPFAFLTDYANTDSITDNVAPFLGMDSVTFTYSPITYSDLRTNNNSSYAYHATVQDAMQFSVSYLYCKASVTLASDLTLFTVRLTEPSTVQLNWSSVSETSGRHYAIQRSQDGQHFETIGIVEAVDVTGAADYAYTDHLPAGGSTTGNKWYYRLQVNDPGLSAYSGIRLVSLNGETGGALQVYPNPAAAYINVVLEQNVGTSVRNSWQADILSADGALLQRTVYQHAGVVRVDFQRRLSAGTYFVRIVDLPGQHTRISPFIVSGGR